MATLYTIEILVRKLSTPAQVWFMSFGQPRVGNHAFANMFSELTVRAQSFRIVHRGDIVAGASLVLSHTFLLPPLLWWSVSLALLFCFVLVLQRNYSVICFSRGPGCVCCVCIYCFWQGSPSFCGCSSTWLWKLRFGWIKSRSAEQYVTSG